MWAILPYLPLLAITIAANLGVTRRGWRWLTYVGLALPNLLLAVSGLLMLVGPLLLRWIEPGAAAELANTIPLGLAALAVALLGLLCLLPAVRRLLARVLPIDPDSPVHATALVFVIYLAASSLSLFLAPPAVVLDSLESVGIGSGALVSGQAVMLLFALAGVGLGTRRNLPQTLERLGLRWPTLRQLALAAGLVALFLVMDTVVSIIWERLWPLNYQLVSESNQRLFAPFGSIPGALVLGLTAGIGEETLFRGALQPRLRILLTALVFTLGHVQYTLSPALAQILFIGLVLGWLRERTNTTTCVVAHAGYNFVGAILMWLFP